MTYSFQRLIEKSSVCVCVCVVVRSHGNLAHEMKMKNFKSTSTFFDLAGDLHRVCTVCSVHRPREQAVFYTEESRMAFQLEHSCFCRWQLIGFDL